MEEILDLNSFCRFCLNNLEEAVPISDKIQEFFENLTNLEMLNFTSCSNFTCQQCLTELKKCLNFKNKLMKNQQRLQEILLSLEDPMNHTVVEEITEIIPNLNEIEEDSYLEMLEQIKDEDSSIQESNSETTIETRKSPVKFKGRPGSKEKSQCTDCGEYVSSKYLTEHYKRVHLGIKRFECDYCGKQFYLKKRLKDHLKSHVGVADISCNLCDLKFKTNSTLLMHRNKIHLMRYVHFCHQCGSRFNTKINFETHYRAKHTGERPFICDFVECGKGFHSKNELQSHKKQVHSSPAKCPVCLKYFSSENSLKSHLKHHEEYRFLCSFVAKDGTTCEKKFVSKANLKKHLKSHQGIKDFACHLCTMTYYKASDLQRHIIAFHMKVKLKCEIQNCKSQFARKETYKNHVLTQHKDLEDQQLQNLLESIKNYQLPKISLNSSNILK